LITCTRDEIEVTDLEMDIEIEVTKLGVIVETEVINYRNRNSRNN
jgi:hypothetical protein